jgi:ABC-type bacteriocin/lantibiotic exporter with double-glycine peptidase domain
MRQIFIYGNYFFIAVKDMFFTKLNLYFIGAILIFNNKLTIATLLLFMKYFEQFFQSINTITNLDIQFKEDIPSIDRVSEVLFVYAEDNRKMLYVRDVKEGIKCSDVYFRYNDDTDFILKDINLNIKNKEKIAIVGKSGSGKSTLAKLLVGMYNPLKGNIKLDGNDMTHIKSASLHRAMGIVMQDSILFNISIKDNLLLAKPDATDEEINEACDKAFISEFINGLPDGYMTLVGEKGVKLSGGQKQRLAIARVILTNPDIIIFDESTSALDHESEKNINKAIENIALEKTVIIIAHRLSTILSVNRVIVMRNGCIVGEGSHSELLGNNVEYDTLFGKQYKKIIAS